MNQLLPTRMRREPPDTLRFAPLAWLKLQWFCHAGDTEVGGFGVSAEHNPLYVEDFVSVRQRTLAASVRFDDAAVADLFDELVDRGLKPDRFARIWIHTHPGRSPQPSLSDEETFASGFGGCAWSVMFILSRAGETYARLSFPAGPGGMVELASAVDWAPWPKTPTDAGLDAQVERWKQEYAAHVQPVVEAPLPPAAVNGNTLDPGLDWWDVEPWDAELDGFFYEPIREENAYELLS